MSLDPNSHTLAFTAAWHAAVAARDAAALGALLADDARLVSPIAFKPYTSRREILAIFGAIMQVLPDLTYTRSEMSARGGFMVFEGTLAGGLRIEGLDLFTLGEGDGRATELKVFVRPLKAASAFAEAMAKALGAHAGSQ